MELLVSSLLTMVANLIVFSAVPFVWWALRHRREVSFFRWLGFIRPRLQSPWWVLVLFACVYYFFYSFDYTSLLPAQTMETLASSDSVSANAFAGLGAAAILPALIQNFIANGVAEEILFRGFLCKRLCGKLGRMPGIVLQAVLFGLMHNVLFLVAGVPVGGLYHALMFGFTAVGALLLGLLNEKIFNGSLWPSILLHGAGNFLTSMTVAFLP